MSLIQPIDKVDLRHLISTSKEISLKTNEVQILDRVLLSSSMVWAGLLPDGRLACTWGLVPRTMLSDYAYLWLYTSELVVGHEFLFVRQSQLAVEEMLEHYPGLYGMVEADNPSAMRWLRWLGAEFGPAALDGIPFIIRRKTCSPPQS